MAFGSISWMAFRTRSAPARSIVSATPKLSARIRIIVSVGATLPCSIIDRVMRSMPAFLANSSCERFRFWRSHRTTSPKHSVCEKQRYSFFSVIGQPVVGVLAEREKEPDVVGELARREVDGLHERRALLQQVRPVQAVELRNHLPVLDAGTHPLSKRRFHSSSFTSQVSFHLSGCSDQNSKLRTFLT